MSHFALQFSQASSQSVNLSGQGTALQLVGTSYTIATWLNLSSIPSFSRVMNMQNDTDFTGGYAIYIDGGGGIHFTHADGASDQGFGSSTNLTTGVWVHVVIVYDMAGSTGYIYLNGAVNASQAITLPLATSNVDPLYLAASPNFGQWFDGFLTQTLFFARALSGTEVSALYNSGAGSATLPTGNQVAIYQYSEGTGTTLSDSSGNGFNGLLVNTPSWVSSPIPATPPTPPPTAPYRQGGGYAALSTYLVGSLLPSVTTIRLANIYDYEPTDLAGYPACTVTATELQGRVLDNTRNERIERFMIRIFIDRNKQNFGASQTEVILRTLADEIMLKIDADATLNGNCIDVIPFPARFGYIERQNNNIRVMEITLDCRIAVTWR